ncbi:hypothetical protein, partial [Malonomonas rubra]|uniref:hypothetical protein n=1 Tax=Malonomonas rubra TaxID=57040 RepID=UPI001ABFB266
CRRILNRPPKKKPKSLAVADRQKRMGVPHQKSTKHIFTGSTTDFLTPLVICSEISANGCSSELLLPG